ncbi:MAG: family 20 glycosylhydrolase [Verrucomicrobiota bacterium]
MNSELFSAPHPAVPRRGIHLDLKGVAPSFPRLLELLSLFGKLRFNTVLVEWEDMFPWTCDPRLRGCGAYTATQVRRFADQCAELGLEIIPLVQSLGHAENVLRLPGNEGLREIAHRTDVFHPLNPESARIVQDMVADALTLLPDVKHFHLGGDEAYTFGQHPDCRDFLRDHSMAELYLRQLNPIIDDLAGRGIRPLLWHDEFVAWSPGDLTRLAPRADLVVWGYTGDPRDPATYHYRLPHADKLHAAGCTLWAATAYKGADGPGANLPDVTTRQKSTLAWAELTPRFDLQGVFATGWSRYASGRIQVTPIDGALDSLVNTASILHEGRLPAGGLDACLAWLDAHGEGEAFRRCQDALARLTKHTDKAWDWIRQLEEQAANLELEPDRAHSGIEEIIFELFDKDIAEIARAGADLEAALAGRIDAPWPRYYHEVRRRPIEAAAERLRAQLASAVPVSA